MMVSLPLLKVVVFFVYVLKWSLLGVPKKVEPHPDCSQRFNSKFRPSISAPFIWEPKPNNFSPLLFLYGKCIPSFRIPHNALCLFPPPPTLPFLCINYCCQMLQGGLLIPREHWKTISYTEFKANRPRVYYGGFAWGKNENLDLNIKDQRDIRILWRKPRSSNTHFIQQNDTYYKIKGIKIILQTLSSYSYFEQQLLDGSVDSACTMGATCHYDSLKIQLHSEELHAKRHYQHHPFSL